MSGDKGWVAINNPAVAELDRRRARQNAALADFGAGRISLPEFERRFFTTTTQEK